MRTKGIKRYVGPHWISVELYASPDHSVHGIGPWPSGYNFVVDHCSSCFHNGWRSRDRFFSGNNWLSFVIVIVVFYNSSSIRLGTTQRFGGLSRRTIMSEAVASELIQFLSSYFSRVAKILGNIASGRLKWSLVSLNRWVPYNSANRPHQY